MNGNVEEVNWLPLYKPRKEKDYNLQNRELSNAVTKKHLLTQALPQLFMFVPKYFTKIRRMLRHNSSRLLVVQNHLTELPLAV